MIIVRVCRAGRTTATIGGTDATGRMLDPTPAVLSLEDLERGAARVMPVAAEAKTVKEGEAIGEPGDAEAVASSTEGNYRGVAGLGAFLPLEFREKEGGGVDATEARLAVPQILSDMVENFERLVDPRSYIGRTPKEALGRHEVAGVAEEGTGGAVASRPLSDGSVGETTYDQQTPKTALRGNRKSPLPRGRDARFVPRGRARH